MSTSRKSVKFNRHTAISLLATIGAAGFGFALAKLLLDPSPDRAILASWAGTFLSFALAGVLDRMTHRAR